ncbi:MAG: peptide ABC transporter substrate-binding protein [Clostridia bacterium]|nr:peptide ABC transporter substrate-binding protein [Clostridia bacterium]
MKKVLALVLGVLMVLSAFSGCALTLDTLEFQKRGANPVYFGAEPIGFDPIKNADIASLRYLTMHHMGLYVVNEKGKVVESLCTGIKWDDEDPNKMIISLAESRWTDGSYLNADDFIYAWKRVLDPANESPYAHLFFEVLNAKNYYEGKVSIDDVGILALDDYTIEVEFEGKGSTVFENMLSCAVFYPLREDTTAAANDWYTRPAVMIGSGAGYVSAWDKGKTLAVAQSNYFITRYKKYFLSKDEGKDAYQIGFSVVANKTEEELADMFVNEQLLFMAEVPQAVYEKVEATGWTKSVAADATATVFFNYSKNKFDAQTRKALSLALDRNALASGSVLAQSAATAFVPNTISDVKTNKSDFRKAGGALISASADTAAKQALSGNAPSFTLTVIDNSSWVSLGEKMAQQWEANLGAKVTVKALDYDDFVKAEKNGNYEAILVPFNALFDDAYGMLERFLSYSGFNTTGYADEAYDKMIADALACETKKDRVAAMHEAEKYLVEQMAAIPVVFMKYVYAVNPHLSDISVTASGAVDIEHTHVTMNSIVYTDEIEAAKREAEKAAKEKEKNSK